MPEGVSNMITDVSHLCNTCKEYTGLYHWKDYHWCTKCRAKMDKCEPGVSPEMKKIGSLFVLQEDKS